MKIIPKGVIGIVAILLERKGLQVLSIPLKGGKHQQQSIREVLISHETPWGSQHWTAIKSAYGKSPFFEFYADELYPFFTKKYEYLWEWNWDLLQALIQLLQLDAEIERTEIYQKQVSEGIIDFRNGISPKYKPLQDLYKKASPKYLNLE